MKSTFDDIPDLMLIEELQRRGYRVRHNSEGSRTLSHSRAEPFPKGMISKDFLGEALKSIREQLTESMLSYSTHELQAVEGVDFTPTRIHQARLKLF